MLYLIGLGLNEKSLTREGKEAIEKCSKLYLESYTVDFPYSISALEREIRGKIITLGRKEVESDRLIKEAKKENIALLIYGCPLFATTHLALILDAKKENVKTKIIYNASVFEALAETGLQLYKFGKITSMPRWQKNYSPESFIDVVKENQSIKAHTLILMDIGLKLNEALEQLKKALENKKLNVEKIIICSNLGTEKSKILYNSIENLKNKKIENPFCIIIPGELHFTEKEYIGRI